jgi:hypothetical protein
MLNFMFKTQNKREVTTVTMTSRWEEEKEKNRKRKATIPPLSVSENATTVEPTLQPALVTSNFANTGGITNNREAPSDIASTTFYTAADKQEDIAPTTPRLSLFDPVLHQPATPSSGASPAFNAGQAPELAIGRAADWRIGWPPPCPIYFRIRALFRDVH